jgi:long-chain fatty acid transport protein
MKKSLLLMGMAVCGLFHESSAGGFKIGLQGQKQLGMGHTGVGFAQDAATIYFNPAGMSFVGSQFTGGMFTLIPSTSFLEKGTNTITNATSQVFTPFEVFATTKLSNRINFGVGVYTPFGSGIMYPTDWSGRNILHRIDLKAIFIQPTLSLRLSNNFSLGAGFIYSTGSVLLEKDLPIVSGPNQDIANAQLKGHATGIGFNAGAYLKASEKFNIGVTYHSKVKMSVKEGTAVFENIPSALTSNFPNGNTFKTDLPLPSELAAGISYKASPRTTIAIDMNYTFWNSFDSLGFDYAKNSASLTDAKSQRLYKNAIAVRAGIQYNASKNVMLRVGGFYDQTPVQDGYVAPELPDNDKLGLTCGASFKCSKRLSLDMSFLYEHLGPREQTNKETGLSGTFKTKAIAPGIGINYLLHKKSTTN